MRTVSILRAGALVLLAGLAVGACGDGTGPGTELAGTYVLSSVDGRGDPLITVDHTFSSGDRLVGRVIYDSLTFTSATTIQRSTLNESVTHRTEGGQIGPHQAYDSHPGTFRRAGERLIVTWQSTANPGVGGVDTLRIGSGRLTATGLIGLWCVEGCPEPRAVPFVYERR